MLFWTVGDTGLGRTVEDACPYKERSNFLMRSTLSVLFCFMSNVMALVLTHFSSYFNNTLADRGKYGADTELDEEVCSDENEENVRDDILSRTDCPTLNAGEEDGEGGDGEDCGVDNGAGDGGNEDGGKGALFCDESIEQAADKSCERSLEYDHRNGDENADPLRCDKRVEGGG